MPDVVGQVLDERPAALDGHHLHAPADAEHGQSAGVGRVEERELPRVPVGAPADRCRVRLGGIPPRIDVGATGHHQGVQPGDDGVGRGRLLRREQHGYAAGPLDRVGVQRRQHVGRLVPDAPAGLLAIRREADQWLHAHAPLTGA